MAKGQEGIVIETYGTMAKVKTSRHNDCESCGACPGNSALVLEALNPVNAHKGQRVELQIGGTGMLTAAFIVFIAPLLAAVAGTVAGYYLASATGYAVLPLQIAGAITSFVLAVLYIRYFDRAARSKSGMQPVIIRICDN